MKAQVSFDTGTHEASVTVSFANEEEAAQAVDAVKAAANSLWPGIVFYEDDAPGAQAPAPQKRARKAVDYTRPPAADSLHGRILAFARIHGRCEREEISRQFKIESGVAAMAIARLRKGGHLKGLS